MVVDGVAGRKHDGVNASDSACNLHTHLRVVRRTTGPFSALKRAHTGNGSHKLKEDGGKKRIIA